MRDAVGRAGDSVDRLRSAISLRPDYVKAHYNLAVALCMKGSYADAWGEVHMARRLGFEPPQAFLKLLSDRMQEPR